MEEWCIDLDLLRERTPEMSWNVYGPVYKGIGQIIRWFEDWNRKGTVLQWDIKRVIVSGNIAVVEWYFKCDYEGNVDGFNGVTIAEFNADMKIGNLKEFKSKAEHYCPYEG